MVTGSQSKNSSNASRTRGFVFNFFFFCQIKKMPYTFFYIFKTQSVPLKQISLSPLFYLQLSDDTLPADNVE